MVTDPGVRRVLVIIAVEGKYSLDFVGSATSLLYSLVSVFAALNDKSEFVALTTSCH
jgi:hypothetical protein